MIRLAEPDRPWIFRTYAGHTSVEASNRLFRDNLARGQTGLSIAFDLPTQCGHSSDEEIAAPEVGKVGVPVNSLDDMRALFDGIPLDRMNTSMTINATAMWLYALYLALAEEQGVPLDSLQGTTQNDIVKEYLSRGTYIFPPGPSVRLIADMYEHAVREVPRFNPANVCSYHLQEAGATPVQEVAYALSTATLVLDELRGRDTLTKAEFEQAVGRVSFFCNAGLRFVEELCKMRAFAELWDRTCLERYGVEDPKLRRFRYGVQVNSLGLTEEQPENNAWRIAIEMLGVLLSRDARCRALQLPAWNEALSLPRPWDQQWSLRLQQIMALETDVLDYPDLFEGSTVVRALQDELIAGVERGAGAHRRLRRHPGGARVGADEVGAGRERDRPVRPDRARRSGGGGPQPLRGGPRPRRSWPAPTAASFAWRPTPAARSRGSPAPRRSATASSRSRRWRGCGTTRGRAPTWCRRRWRAPRQA